jgi:UDP-N-acetylglucosamine--N-acetylmuramyl-(pentapeptide) pyrophosphoryl-undecaprenol N-acetylglucosamine transferase
MMIAAGGTGGHVYPAIAVAEVLRQRAVELSFVGSAGGFERPLLDEAGIHFAHYDEVRAGPLHGVGLLRALISLANLTIGTLQSLRLVGRYRPQALLLTGGWVGLPVAAAARLRGVPSLIYLPDIEPGLAIRILQRFARRVATTVSDSAAYFPPGKTLATGYPVRAETAEAARDPGARARAIGHFSLDPARKTLLVFGGSRGARTINLALLDILPQLLADGWQVLHVTGTLDWEPLQERRQSLADTSHYHAYAYLHDEMALAFVCADLVVCRAGASTLGELPLFGLPAILVPYPYAWRYQKVNAEWLAQRGAALVMEDAAMAETLLPTIRTLMQDSARLETMRAAAAALAQPEGAQNVARELLHLAGESL